MSICLGCGLNENAHGRLHGAWHEVLCKWQHFETKSVTTLVTTGEQLRDPYFGHIFSDRDLKEIPPIHQRCRGGPEDMEVAGQWPEA